MTVTVCDTRVCPSDTHVEMPWGTEARHPHETGEPSGPVRQAVHVGDGRRPGHRCQGRAAAPCLGWGLGKPRPRGRRVRSHKAPWAPTPRSALRATETPTLAVWQVTISAATHVLTSSALRTSCSRYLSCTQLGRNRLQVLAGGDSEVALEETCVSQRGHRRGRGGAGPCRVRGARLRGSRGSGMVHETLRRSPQALPPAVHPRSLGGHSLGDGCALVRDAQGP